MRNHEQPQSLVSARRLTVLGLVSGLALTACTSPQPKQTLPTVQQSGKRLPAGPHSTSGPGPDNCLYHETVPIVLVTPTMKDALIKGAPVPEIDNLKRAGTFDGMRLFAPNSLAKLSKDLTAAERAEESVDIQALDAIATRLFGTKTAFISPGYASDVPPNDLGVQIITFDKPDCLPPAGPQSSPPSTHTA